MTTIKRALDVGCGTGIVTHELAQMLPEAIVTGIDLTPVPAVREKLRNIEYLNGDFLAMSNPANPEAPFEGPNFDYIFSRLLVMGIGNWPEYVQRCVSLVKPGVSEQIVRKRTRPIN